MRFCPYKTFAINTNHVGNPVVGGVSKLSFQCGSRGVYQNYHFNVAVGGCIKIPTLML